MTEKEAVLVLADGSVFRGRSIGAAGAAVGEVVFNTAMTGYQEILTDPSYCRQIVTLTYPHIGNTGTNEEDQESARVFAEGLVVRDLPRLHSSWRSQKSLSDYLIENNVVGISDLDTRKLTRILREKGAQSGCVMAGKVDVDEALMKAKQFPGLSGMDLAKVVTTKSPYEWREGRWELGSGYRTIENPRFHVVAYDYGIKRNILRLLAERSARITVVPASLPAREVLKMKPDGVFLANGPGDPEPCDYAIEAIGEILDATRVPVFGICLGHQLMGLASGAKTLKMKFGHHGANHPVKDLDTGQVVITSQNHGFAVEPESLQKATGGAAQATHVNLNDNTLEHLATNSWVARREHLAILIIRGKRIGDAADGGEVRRRRGIFEHSRRSGHSLIAGGTCATAWCPGRCNGIASVSRRIASRPWRRFSQYSSRSRAPGNRPAMPTTAISIPVGSRLVSLLSLTAFSFCSLRRSSPAGTPARQARPPGLELVAPICMRGLAAGRRTALTRRQVGRQLADGRMAEQVDCRDLPSEGLLETAVDLDQQERVAPEVEEVVVHADLLDLQGFPDQAGDQLLGVGLRVSLHHVVLHRSSLERRQRPPVDLAVGGERQAVQKGHGRRHHVGRQPLAERLAQLRGRQPVVRLGDDEGGDEADAQERVSV